MKGPRLLLFAAALLLVGAFSAVSCLRPEPEHESEIVDPVDSLSHVDSSIVDPPKLGNGVVVVVGGGASGVAAALQAARMGVEVCLLDETPWLGGMLTSAGVTATDGCYNLRGGIFAEFVDALASRYGGLAALKSGWVSNVLFEPSVGNEVFAQMVAHEPKITRYKNTKVTALRKLSRGWVVETDAGSLECEILIDCTELGDIAKMAGVRYHVGMDAPSYGGETMALGPNAVVQDLTMVMTVKDYGRDVTIPRPEGYDERRYVNCCKNALNVASDTGQTLWSPGDMLSYGKTPKGKFMLNWPISGNDFYVNMVDMSAPEREDAVREAKNVALGYLYFIQTRLGYKTLGLADDEYPTEDRFPFFPYHRESRRIEGKCLFTVNEAVDMYCSELYRTGVAVGDYPVDHHHFAYADWKSVDIAFPQIKPFTVPLGCMVPMEVEDLIVAEKSISVTNIINGSTRLQPVCLELGQAAGVMAALAASGGTPVREIAVRQVQEALLEAGAYLMPYLDAPPTEDFVCVQRMGATGIMRGHGETVGWSNQCRFRVDDPVLWNELYLEDYYGIPHSGSASPMSVSDMQHLLQSILGSDAEVVEACTGVDLLGSGTGVAAGVDLLGLDPAAALTRYQAARLLDHNLRPFDIPVNWKGALEK